MRVQGAEAYSINRVVDNNIIFAKDGSVCIVYHLKLPYKYALNEAKFDSRIQELFEAFSKTPNDCYIHKQDVYLKDSFNTSGVRDRLFLDEAFINYYENCPTLGHSCILAFVLTNLKSLEKSYLKNPFKFDKHLSSEDKETLLIFSDGVKKSISIINNIYNSKALEFKQEDLKYYLYRYVNGFVKTGYYDIDFRDKKIGDTYFDLYSFSRIEYFPDHITNIRKDNLSLENAPIYEGFMDMAGESFFANHIYNQIIYFQGDKLIQSEIDLRMGEYAKMRNISERIHQKANQLKAFLEEVNTPLSETVLVKSHFNLILFDQDSEILKRDKAKFENILNSHSISFHKPEKEILKDIFLGSIIGREKKLHKDNFFITHLKQALCLFSNTTLFKGDTKGVYFNERVLQTPVLLDTWDEEKKRISARNGIIVAGTGGGKSVTALNIITQYLSEGINVVVAEFGMSFKFITNLYPEISKHIRYNSSMPLGVNPFKLSQEGLTNEKLDLLNAIILKTWRIKSNFDDTHVSVSINKILKFYYSVINFDHSYESFYNFVISFEKSDLERLDIDEKYFDLGSFRHICSEFISGGKYENVFKIDESTTEIIRNKQFVVFELTEIKKDPFLVTLILLILQETIDTNILSDRGKKGALFFDEFAESSEMKDIYSGEEVLHSVATMYQKIRKENGSVWTIIQDPSQLPDNRYTKGIIANTQILMVLPSEEVTYKAIERSFELPEVATYLMKNIKSNKSLEKRPYTELFIKIGGEYLILRLELSKEAFLAFQTDGNLWDELAKDFELSGNFQKSISNIKYKYYEKNN